MEFINRGFSAPLNPRRVYIVLIDMSGKVFEFETDTNLKQWQPFKPGDENFAPLRHYVELDAPLPSEVKPGWYELGIWMPDPYDSIHLDSRYAIRLANRDTLWWTNDDQEYGINLFGVLKVKPPRSQ